MQREIRVLGIILARGGSKGLPGKNKMMLRGKPLIAWTVQAGLQSVYINDIVVSTDSHEIAEIAQEYGAEVPFIRPENLATDASQSADSISHAIRFLQEQGRKYDYVILLEPTSPMRDNLDIDDAISMLISCGGSALVSVCRASTSHPSFMFTMESEQKLRPYENIRSVGSLRRQDLSRVFYPDGSLYISSIETFQKEMTFYHEGTLGFEMPRWKSFEIDDDLDFLLVETIMREKEIGS